MSEATLTSRIAAARRVIVDTGKQQARLRTIARRGFRFVGEVRQEASDAGFDAAVTLVSATGPEPASTAPSQELKFLRTGDDVHLAVATVGAGPTLVKATNWLNHLEYDWRSPVWAPTLIRLAANYRLVRYDGRGLGLDEFRVKIPPFLHLVDAIVRDEGFLLNRLKTRVMHRSTAQRITGLVVNEHINVSRKAYDELKATLHNCAKFGPHDQNRRTVADFRAHLDGRISWVEAVNTDRGAKLRCIFDCIQW